MIIKKYVGKTEEEASAQAKAELGENVVIMNVRNTRKKGFFHFLKKQQVEVTVALEEENERYPQEADRRQEEDIKETFRQVAQAVGVSVKEENSPKTSEKSVQNDKLSGNKAESKTEQNNIALEEKLDTIHNMIEKQFIHPEKEEEKDRKDKKEKESTKEDRKEENSEMLRFMKLLYNTMLDNEVNEKYANQIIDEMEKNALPNMPFDHALANVYQKMILKFGKADPISPSEQTPKVVFFVGPTGVGKTTTIAKIASKFSVEEQKKVALLTADTYRIAAAEQLRTYANILEVPFRVIYSVDEMESALRDFRGFDYVLVDTAGHSHHNQTQKENMNAFIHSVDGLVEKEVHLVLSATTKYRDLLSIADTYMGMTEFKIIFTKLDETTTLGNLLNLKLYTGASLSYITCGQNVPDDIEIFNPQKTVKQLLGGKN